MKMTIEGLLSYMTDGAFVLLNTLLSTAERGDLVFPFTVSVTRFYSAVSPRGFAKMTLYLRPDSSYSLQGLLSISDIKRTTLHSFVLLQLSFCRKNIYF